MSSPGSWTQLSDTYTPVAAAATHIHPLGGTPATLNPTGRQYHCRNSILGGESASARHFACTGTDRQVGCAGICPVGEHLRVRHDILLDIGLIEDLQGARALVGNPLAYASSALGACVLCTTESLYIYHSQL